MVSPSQLNSRRGLKKLFALSRNTPAFPIGMGASQQSFGTLTLTRAIRRALCIARDALGLSGALARLRIPESLMPPIHLLKPL
jgi:hypothetical protein